MKSFVILIFLFSIVYGQSVYDFTADDLDGKPVKLDKYKGQVLVIVNVASNCGLAKYNYPQFNDLYKKYKDAGLRILAFPSNQFNQEPGTREDIKKFLEKYGVKFDVFDKIAVNGDNAHPLYKYLKSQKSGPLGPNIEWNFAKFLVDKTGKVVARYASVTQPKNMEEDIKKLL